MIVSFSVSHIKNMCVISNEVVGQTNVVSSIFTTISMSKIFSLVLNNRNFLGHTCRCLIGLFKSSFYSFVDNFVVQ